MNKMSEFYSHYNMFFMILMENEIHIWSKFYWGNCLTSLGVYMALSLTLSLIHIQQSFCENIWMFPFFLFLKSREIPIFMDNNFRNWKSWRKGGTWIGIFLALNIDKLCLTWAILYGHNTDCQI